MSNRRKCPSCGTPFTLPEGSGRSTFTCPGCGKPLRFKPQARRKPVAMNEYGVELVEEPRTGSTFAEFTTSAPAPHKSTAFRFDDPEPDKPDDPSLEFTSSSSIVPPVEGIKRPASSNAKARPSQNLWLPLGAGVVVLILVSVGATLWTTGVLSITKTRQQAKSNEKVAYTNAKTAVDANKDGKSNEKLNTPDVAMAPGKLRLLVTYKFNDFVGNRADTDAVVILVPQGIKEKISDTVFLSPSIARISVETTKSKLKRLGSYIAIVGGDGRSAITGITPGRYRLFVFSKNTNDSPQINEARRGILELYFDDTRFAVLSKVLSSEIEIAPGEELEMNHDFGITHF